MKDKQDQKKRKEKKERVPEPEGTGTAPGDGGGEGVPAAGGEPEKDAPLQGREEGEPGSGAQEGTDPEGSETEEPEEVRLAREAEQWQEKYVRLMADFENYKKRASKEKANLIQYGNETLLKDLLPVIDNMERVLAYSLQEGDWKDFQRGVELVVTEIHKTLSQHGVQPLQVLGTDFDPNLHEAMRRVETDDAAPNTVVEEFQKGYLFRDRLLRASLVAVAAEPQGIDGAEAEDPAEEPDAGSENAVATPDDKDVN